MGLFLAFFIGAVCLSFACSLLEAVILSATPAYISVRVKRGETAARILDKMKKKINRPLIAILTVNTAANTMGSTGVSIQAMHLWGEPAIAAASGAVTLAILILGEIIPKTLGAAHWKKFAPVAAYGLQALVIVTFPIILIMEQVIRFVGGKRQKLVTRAELIESAEIGASEGSLKRHESVVIRNLLMMEKVLVSDIMTPRTEMTVFPADITIEKLMAEHPTLRYTRVPVFQNSVDNICGVVHRFRIMDAVARSADQTLVKDLMAPVEKVQDEITVAQVLDLFILKNRHLFVVVDEKNRVEGIVTMEDAIETLLGVDIVDEFESSADMRKYAAEMLKKRHELLKTGLD
jgi:CBS domain containing-hemolysin-like protein